MTKVMHTIPTWHQKLNIEKADPTALRGISRKLLNMDKKSDTIYEIRDLVRTKEMQSFTVKSKEGTDLVSSNRSSNLWVLTSGSNKSMK